MHHFVTEMCTHVHISVTKWCILGYGLVHCGICAICLLCLYTWPLCCWFSLRLIVMLYSLITYKRKLVTILDFEWKMVWWLFIAWIHAKIFIESLGFFFYKFPYLSCKKAHLKVSFRKCRSFCSEFSREKGLWLPISQFPVSFVAVKASLIGAFDADAVVGIPGPRVCLVSDGRIELCVTGEEVDDVWSSVTDSTPCGFLAVGVGSWDWGVWLGSAVGRKTGGRLVVVHEIGPVWAVVCEVGWSPQVTVNVTLAEMA